MSIDGYKLPKMSLDELMAFIKQFRAKAKILCREMLIKHYTDMIMETIDRHALGRVPSEWVNPSLPLMMAAKFHIAERCEKIYRTNRRDPEFDYGFEMCLFPMDDKILVQTFSDKEEYTELWESRAIVEDYHYQNNADISNYDDKKENWDKMSKERKAELEEDWNHRYEDWEKAFDFGILNLHGLSAMIVNHSHLPWLEEQEVLDAMPSFEDRVKNSAVNIVLNEKIKELNGGEEYDVNTIFGIVREASKWIEGQKEKVEKKCDEIKDKLYPEITIEHLRMVMKDKETA